MYSHKYQSSSTSGQSKPRTAEMQNARIPGIFSSSSPVVSVRARRLNSHVSFSRTGQTKQVDEKIAHETCAHQPKTTDEPDVLRTLMITEFAEKRSHLKPPNYWRDWFMTYFDSPPDPHPIESIEVNVDAVSKYLFGIVKFHTAERATGAILKGSGCFNDGRTRYFRFAYADKAGAKRALAALGRHEFRLYDFCREVVPEFTPLGANQPECAVVACAAIWLHTKRLQRGVIMAPDVLDTMLAALCAPFIITDTINIAQIGPFSGSPCLAVRLKAPGGHTCKTAITELHNNSNIDWFHIMRLSIVMELGKSARTLPHDFLSHRQEDEAGEGERSPLLHCNLRHTSLQSIGHRFIAHSSSLVDIELPQSLTEVGNKFLLRCSKLQRVSLQHTTLTRVGTYFLFKCPQLTSVDLPQTLSYISKGFLSRCSKLEDIDLRRTAAKSVGENFLSQCESLTRVALPQCLTHVDDGFLSCCPALT